MGMIEMITIFDWLLIKSTAMITIIVQFDQNIYNYGSGDRNSYDMCSN